MRGPTGGLRRFIAGRVPPADLDERDPDYIRETLPRLWLLSSLYFRGEVRGLGNVPEDGPVLLVGNHSGGNLTPDTHVFTLAFSTYFGVERRFHQLAHNLVLSFPGLSFLRKYGTVAASQENARRALEAGAAVLVYPGGDYEVHRPSWERHRVDFGGRKGFIRLAIEQDVPIVPVVAVGGQETALFLTPRRAPRPRVRARQAVPAEGAAALARAPLGAQRRRHARPHPAAGQDHRRGAAADPPARGVRPRAGRRRGLRARRAADAGDARGARRRAALPGDRMRIAEHVDVRASPGIVWEQVSDPSRVLDFFAGVTRWECCGGPRTGLGARYRMLMRVGSAEVGGLIETVECAPERDLAWTSITGIDQRGRWRLREVAGGTRVELRLQYGVAGGGIWSWLAEQLGGPIVRGNVKRTLAQLKRAVEHEQVRADAARRRAART